MQRLYIVEVETYLDEIDGDSPCLFNIVVVILLYVDDVDVEQVYKNF